MKSTNLKQTLQLLLVEDSISDAALLQENILLSGTNDLRVSVVQSLRQAIHYLKNNPVDATLLDLSLPDSSGLETIIRLRQACPDTPIVVLTGVDDEKTGVEAVRMGVQDYLVKGQVDGRLIARAVRYAIERKRMEDELRRHRDTLELQVQERTKAISQTVDTLQTEIENRIQAEKKILTYQQRLRSLATEIIMVEERERRTIAAALHDSLGPLLAFSKRELGILRKSAPPEIAGPLGHVHEMIEQAVGQTRSLTFDLSPPTLYTLGLGHALEELVERFSTEGKFKGVFNTLAQEKSLTEDVKILLYRLVRELLVNIAKHAQAKNVNVTLTVVKNHIQVVVEDDGIGFDVSGMDLQAGKSSGFGLFNVYERLTQAGGRLDIQSGEKKGTTVVLQLPLTHKKGEQDDEH
jgi:signal transduction histidine kinase